MRRPPNSSSVTESSDVRVNLYEYSPKGPRMSSATSGKMTARGFGCPDCAWLIGAMQIVAASARTIRLAAITYCDEIRGRERTPARSGDSGCRTPIAPKRIIGAPMRSGLRSGACRYDKEATPGSSSSLRPSVEIADNGYQRLTAAPTKEVNSRQ